MPAPDFFVGHGAQLGVRPWPPWTPHPPGLRPHPRCILVDEALPPYVEQFDGEQTLTEIIASYEKVYTSGAATSQFHTLAQACFWRLSGISGWQQTVWGDRARFLSRARAGLLKDVANTGMLARQWAIPALVYDWIYAELTPDERLQVLQAIARALGREQAQPTLNNIEELATRAGILLAALATAGDHAWGDTRYASLETWWRNGAAGDFLAYFSEPGLGGFGEGVSYSTHTRGQIIIVLFEESLRTATRQTRAAYYHAGHWLRNMAYWYVSLLMPQAEPKGVVHRCWRAQAPRTLSEADSVAVTRYHMVSGDPEHQALLRYLQTRRQGPLLNTEMGIERNALVAKVLYGVNEKRIAPKSPDELQRPLRVHHERLGMIYARTGWQPHDTFVGCQVGKWQLGNYAPKQMGNFFVYRNGPALLNPSPEVHYSWADGTIGGNCLHFPSALSAGTQPDRGAIGNLSQLVAGGPRDLVDGLTLDLSRPDVVTWTLDYQRAYGTDVVRRLRRSFVWLVPALPGIDPDLFVVYDWIELADPAREPRAVWHVGAVNAPLVYAERVVDVQRGTHWHTAAEGVSGVVSTVDTTVAKNIVAITPITPVRIVLVGGPNAAGQWSKADSHEYEDAFGKQLASDAVSTQNRPYNGWGRVEEIPLADPTQPIEMLRVIEVTDLGKLLTPVTRVAEGVDVGGRLVRLENQQLVV